MNVGVDMCGCLAACQCGRGCGWMWRCAGVGALGGVAFVGI